MEIGPRDLKNQQFVAVSRDNNSKTTVAMANAVDGLNRLMDEMQQRMFDK